jgi:hypothetical protein
MADQTDDALEAARRLGIEADAEEARKWMLAVAAAEDADQIAADVKDGIFGDRISLLDFDTDDLTRFRRLVPHVRVAQRPEFESAISIAGSAAQGKVQVFPGDADYFERVNIHAPTLDDAKQMLRDAMRETALRAASEEGIVLLEVDMGSYPEPVVERGRHKKAGDSIDWVTEDVVRGSITVEAEGGGERTFQWDDVEVGTGWLFLGWIIAEKEEGRIALASNVIDVTWQAPDGSITALDGNVDPLVQEIYLELGAIELVARLAQHIEPGAKSRYQEIMKEQVIHYTKEQPSYGKAAKRLYNLFRVSDQLESAAFVRELFDEPSAALYQVSGLLDAADVAIDPKSGIDRETVMRQLDVVAHAIEEVTEGEEEASLLADLEQLRQAALTDGKSGESWPKILAEVRDRCAEIVSEFFRVRLMGYEPVRTYLESLEH